MTNKILLFAVALLIALNAITLYSNFSLNKKYESTEAAYSALNDSIHVLVKNGVAEYYQAAPEINLDELTSSEYFKKLSEQQQAFYIELKNTKGLIAATKASISSYGNNTGTVKTDTSNGMYDGDSLVKFVRGDSLSIKDSTEHLNWALDLNFTKPLTYKFKYRYNVDVMSTWKREKDGTVNVYYKLSDTTAVVNNMMNFKIPPLEENKTKFQMWMYKNRWPIRLVVGSAIFVGGTYVGTRLVK